MGVEPGLRLIGDLFSVALGRWVALFGQRGYEGGSGLGRFDTDLVAGQVDLHGSRGVHTLHRLGDGAHAVATGHAGQGEIDHQKAPVGLICPVSTPHNSAGSSIDPMNPTCALNLPINGMTCASCVARVEKAINKVPGVQAASVNLATEHAQISVDSASAPATAQAVAGAITQAGYTVPEDSRDLRIDGMTCASCVARVEKALLKLPGVLEAGANLATNTAHVRRLAGSADDAALLQAVQRAGYAAVLLGTGTLASAAPNTDPGWRVAAAAGLSAPLVLPMLDDLLGQHWMLPALWQWLLATPVLLVFGAPVFCRRLEGFARRRRQHGLAGGHWHQRGIRPEPGDVVATSLPGARRHAAFVL